MTKRIEIRTWKDLRPVDFITGKRLAIPRDQQIPCDCCGKLCMKLAVLTTGHEIGSECASVVDFACWHGVAALALIQATPKQAAFVGGLYA